MLDIKFLRENRELVEKGAKDKGVDIDVEKILQADIEYRGLLTLVQKINEDRNRFARERNIEKGRELKEESEKREKQLREIEEKFRKMFSEIPNLPKPDVKVGKNESENEVLKKVGKPRKFDFTPKDHLELGELLDIIDVERAVKISGARFYFLKNEGVLLERALIQLAYDLLLQEGFIPVLPPLLIKTEIMKAMGYMEKGGDEDMYIFPKDDLALVATSEQSIVPMHKDEIFDTKDLPRRYIGFSSCFRREAGSYGKDTRGIIRVHQFDKVEMVSYTKKGEDDKEHEYLLSLEEKLLKNLDIPYQVSKMCTGDLGFPAARKYDLEAWIPSQNKYRELTSTSTTTDYQSSRLNIKYRDQGKTEYVQILNGTAFSTRPIVAILENYQQEDGSVAVPKILQKYTGFDKIPSKK